MKISQILSTILSALVKIAIAIWVVNFIYTKTMAAYDFGYRVFTEPAISPAPGREVKISITEGKKPMDIAKLLEEKGLVRDHNLAFLQILASPYREGMEPGVYTVTTAMTTDEILKAMNPSESEETAPASSEVQSTQVDEGEKESDDSNEETEGETETNEEETP
ncbi:MAG: endolytic transglycosylase MltG [Lachnospiraceae bacterium]|nr:endolytic transglycosylase MltG [Lachnospiraceae bacterium]